ncbi:MAG: ATP-dependent sacrificial sulfur transferase LarE [Acidobacteriota bacterium]
MTASPETPAPSAPDGDLLRKQARLESTLATLGSVVVAYSGGADSAYLAWVATSVLAEGALCVTAESASYPSRQRELAARVAREFGLRHEFISTGEMDDPGYRANAPDRCYHCKHELFSRLTRLARERGIAAVLDGANGDDRNDYRPGRQAAREFGVLSPLDDADLTKADIRELSRRAGLPTWDEPASACLSSRIPYHTEVTPERLRMIETAEDALRLLGFSVCRVRHHGTLARIELGSNELERALQADAREAIVRAVRSAGYEYVALDLQGYRQGSLNRVLPLERI